MRLTIGEIVEATKGQTMTGSLTDTVTGISTDSRTLKKGQLFFALHGENHDGHRYLDSVFEKGASGAVVDRDVSSGMLNIVRVKDTQRALGDLAQYWRRRFSIPVVAVTGSNGKTTTKDMIAAVLATRYRVLKTEGNFNNLIGLPLTLFRLTPQDEVAVLEMGMNRAGEIDRLAEIGEPKVGVITNVARAHLEGLGSLAHIVRAKAELLGRLPKEGVAVLNKEDSSYPQLKKSSRSRVVTFGARKGSTVRWMSSQTNLLKGMSFSALVHEKKSSFKIHLLGRHNISNALSAIAVGDYFGIPLKEIKKALSAFQSASKRMEVVSKARGIDLINDCYNANPDSVKASLQFLLEFQKQRRHKRRLFIILGDMLELGPSAALLHREVGREVARAKAGFLVAVGEHAKAVVQGAIKGGLSPKKGIFFRDVETAIPTIREHLKPKDLVLIKGSRGMKMERVADAL